MKRMILFRPVLILLFCALLPFFATEAQAIEGALMKGKSLTLLCTSQKADDQFSCQSYIAGIIDYHNLIKGLGTAPTVDFCIPSQTPMSHIKQTVVNYIASHSEHQDFIAAPGVAMALFNAYPCAKKRK